MELENSGLIGNCQFAALIERTGSIRFCCLPRFDAEPVFSTLLDEHDGGSFRVEPADGSVGVQRYVDNTDVLETRFESTAGSFRVLDFAPRFVQFGRMFRPTKIVRIIEPLAGTPMIRVRCDPRLGWSKRVPARDTGSHHVSYDGFPMELRLTTDVPLSYIDGIPYALTEKQHLVLAWGDPVKESLAPLCQRFLEETTRYWQRWVKHCEVPPMFQTQVIRSALALKLHEMVLALAPMFLDERFNEEQSPAPLELLFRLTAKAIRIVGTPDAGIWEVRRQWQPQTFSSMMCWAAADRMAKVAARHAPQRRQGAVAAAESIRAEILDRGYNRKLNSLVATYGESDVDAALLQAAPLRLLAADSPALHGTIDATVRELGRDGWLLRYRCDDGLGVPTTAFVICTFWLVEALALALAGRVQDARQTLQRACERIAPLGLLAEDWDVTTMRMWGNFPQAYSHVGLIRAAFAASPHWDEVI